MKQKIVFLSFLILCINSFLCDKISAQYLDPVINPVWEYYSTNVLSAVSAGKGNTGVASSGDVGLIYLNPATLNIDKKFQVNVGYNLKSDATDRLSQNFFSFSFAAAYKINNNFQTGFAYQNDFSYDHSFHGAIIPEAITEFSFATHSLRIPLVFSHKWMRLGLNVNLMNLSGTEEGLSGNLWKIIPEIGMIVTPIPEFSVGLSFYPGFSGDIKYHYDHSNDEYIYYVKFPNRIKAGTEIRLYDNRLKLSFDYHYANTSSIELLKNQNNYHIGLDYSFNENWNFRCGFFTLYNLLENPNSYYQYSWIYIEHADLGFVTLGTTFKYKNYSFNLGIMDNIVHNSQNISYFVINFGAGYEF
jgi:hypothetical protein